AAEALKAAGLTACYIIGEAMQPFLDAMIAKSPLAGCLIPLTVKNDYFGGNVNVTGLLCACDIEKAIKEASGDLFLLPKVILNDNGVTLDDATVQDMETETATRIHVVSCNPLDFLPEIIALAAPPAL
ncbi:DUF512 domain-containing protein, partial [uncultured Adlercreutzia sp.]|uniref:DUF512 domain-containing protein n=1 Tax=uncultured Adlercreutzia sp. TaxID=875803 RepID=UPI0025D0DFF2